MDRELHADTRVNGWAARWDALRAGWPLRSRVERLTVWLLVAFVLALLGKVLGIAQELDIFVLDVGAVALLPLLLILLYRWFSWRVLWKVRNRLILTYLLMGLAPVVLVVSLAGIAAYPLAGQYATDAAMVLLDQASIRVRDQAYAIAVFGPSQRPAEVAAGSAGAEEGSRISAAELRGNVWVPVMTAKGEANPILGPMPGWLHPGFAGVVAARGKLYLYAEVSVPRGGRQVQMVASSPLTPGQLGGMADGLGKIMLTQGFSRLTQTTNKSESEDQIEDGVLDTGTHHMFDLVTAGKLPPRRHFYDVPVVFGTPITVTSWDTGEAIPTMIVVMSRPTLLYARLFATSVQKGNVVRWLLIGVATFFAMLELAALLMAASLSRTITRSVADLYEGTRAIDAGDLEHRIPVRRRDQLSALATSFNGMTASVSELLVRQRENERLQHELEIAQEVQTTLFPKTPTFLGALEMHGACIAARTVGGDYFDFVFGEGVGAGSVLLALGDISGKGISAALLMSALQSAVRAFSAGMEEADDLPASPAMLLKLLNEHLFRSTQEARYATLFLGLYEAGTGRLTYSNAGHLPPLLLSADGTVRRLEVGGTVVGLMEFVSYDEATVQMEKGDLLVAFTDGLTEPQREEEDFGEERLLAFTRERLVMPLTELGRDLLHEVQVWIGEQEQPDDMTVVLARVR